MTIPTNPSELFSPFLPSTYNIPEEDDRLDTFLVDQLSTFSDVINDKKIGTYITENSTQNGEKWWYKATNVTRNGFNSMIYIDSLPNASTQTITLTSSPKFPIESIDQNFVVTHTWGSASLPPTDPDNTVAGTGNYFSFMNEGDSRISYTISNKQIVITTTVDLSGYSGFIVIEFLRRGA